MRLLLTCVFDSIFDLFKTYEVKDIPNADELMSAIKSFPDLLEVPYSRFMILIACIKTAARNKRIAKCNARIKDEGNELQDNALVMQLLHRGEFTQTMCW